MIVIITNRTLVEEECDSGMVDKLLNKCNRVTGVIRCFHYVNITIVVVAVVVGGVIIVIVVAIVVKVSVQQR